jgi:hypothetical protein
LPWSLILTLCQIALCKRDISATFPLSNCNSYKLRRTGYEITSSYLDVKQWRSHCQVLHRMTDRSPYRSCMFIDRNNSNRRTPSKSDKPAGRHLRNHWQNRWMSALTELYTRKLPAVYGIWRFVIGLTRPRVRVATYTIHVAFVKCHLQFVVCTILASCLFILIHRRFPFVHYWDYHSYLGKCQLLQNESQRRSIRTACTITNCPLVCYCRMGHKTKIVLQIWSFICTNVCLFATAEWGTKCYEDNASKLEHPLHKCLLVCYCRMRHKTKIVLQNWSFFCTNVCSTVDVSLPKPTMFA